MSVALPKFLIRTDGGGWNKRLGGFAGLDVINGITYLCLSQYHRNSVVEATLTFPKIAGGASAIMEWKAKVSKVENAPDIDYLLCGCEDAPGFRNGMSFWRKGVFPNPFLTICCKNGECSFKEVMSINLLKIHTYKIVYSSSRVAFYIDDKLAEEVVNGKFIPMVDMWQFIEIQNRSVNKPEKAQLWGFGEAE